ncbi:hypothetical protein SUGI_0717360 [Cryptomeria japonica]|nr:hypothetical protein SUGI_0717360 [Cryptomeria japonica]
MVQENATLTLTSTGELVLKDADGTLVWSTNTSTHDFQGMAIQVSGNLVLLNNSNGIMWQSFDYPTDTLLLGQKLKVGQNLIANISPTNTSQDNFGCSLSVDSFLMYTAKVPPQIYYRYPKSPPPVKLSYLQFDNEHFHVFPFINFSTPKGCLYFKIIPDGHLQFYSILEASGRSVIDYLSTFTRSLGMCDYPMACGNYGVCRDGQCSCPKEGNDFVQIDATEPNSGCLLNRPLVCSDASKSINPADSRQFLELERMVPTFPVVIVIWSPMSTLSLRVMKVIYFTIPLPILKFSQGISRVSIWFLVIISAAIGGVFLLFLLLYIWISKYRGGRHEKDEDEDDPEDWPSGLPLRYTFQELKHATNDFSMKLGKGGFGSVYEGVLADGSKIAVKRLDGAEQGKKEFRAEVSDKWIFANNMDQGLFDWKTRYKIVLNIARGLTYLHEDCREKIIHFDIKPENILLDQNFNAKVSDFGLAKLINRDQNEVITLLRGTPGYMAPELLNMHFTEKADLFSFGVMVVEIFSGKRSRELSENGLFSVLQVKAEAGRLIDLVYEAFEDDETSVIEEAVKLLKVGMWCVEVDFWRRPAMSTVVKALEGLVDTLDDVPSATTGFPVASTVVKALEGLVDTLDDVPSATTGFPVASNYNSEFAYTPFSVLSGPR